MTARIYARTLGWDENGADAFVASLRNAGFSVDDIAIVSASPEIRSDIIHKSGLVGSQKRWAAAILGGRGGFISIAVRGGCPENLVLPEHIGFMVIE